MVNNWGRCHLTWLAIIWHGPQGRGGGEKKRKTQGHAPGEGRQTDWLHLEGDGDARQTGYTWRELETLDRLATPRGSWRRQTDWLHLEGAGDARQTGYTWREQERIAQDWERWWTVANGFCSLGTSDDTFPTFSLIFSRPPQNEEILEINFRIIILYQVYTETTMNINSIVVSTSDGEGEGSGFNTQYLQQFSLHFCDYYILIYNFLATTKNN
jgi:hypothetical protein